MSETKHEAAGVSSPHHVQCWWLGFLWGALGGRDPVALTPGPRGLAHNWRSTLSDASLCSCCCCCLSKKHEGINGVWLRGIHKIAVNTYKTRPVTEVTEHRQQTDDGHLLAELQLSSSPLCRAFGFTPIPSSEIHSGPPLWQRTKRPLGVFSRSTHKL